MRILYLLLISCITYSCADDDDAKAIGSGRVFVLPVPKDHFNEGSDVINVEYTYVPATTSTQRTVLWLSGGPGQDVLSFKPIVDEWLPKAFPYASVNHVFFNIRGVGEFITPMKCPIAEKSQAESLADCLREIDQVTPLHTFSSSQSAEDIEVLRSTLGIPAWTAVYGQSYGTRLAMEYEKRHPGRVQRLILDGVLSPDAKLFSESGVRLNQSLQRVFDNCDAVTTCKALAGGETWPALLSRMTTLAESNKLKVPVIENQTVTGVVNVKRPVLVSVLELAQRDTQLKPATIRILGEYKQQETQLSAGTPLSATSLLTRFINILLKDSNVFGRFNDLVNVTMNCNESFRFDSVDDATLQALNAQSGIFSDNGYATNKAQCAAVNNLIPPEKNTFTTDIVTSATPTCLLSGIEDPVTPPAWAQRVGEGLTRKHLYNFAFEGHVVMPSTCGVQVVAACLDPDQPPPQSHCDLESPYARLVLAPSEAATAQTPLFENAFVGALSKLARRI